MPITEPAVPAVPQHCPGGRELDDLELLMSGALTPRSGFEDADGLVTLNVPAAVAEGARSLELVDPEGLPLARIDVSATYVSGPGTVGVVGDVTALSHPAYGAFRRLQLTPGQVRTRYAGALFVPVAAPLTTADLARLGEHSGSVVLLALAGTGTPQGVSTVGLVRATLAAAAHLPDAAVVLVPLASRDDPSRDHELGAAVVAVYAGPDPVLGVPGGDDSLEDLPDDVAAVVAADRPGPEHQGLVLFFTGLSGSGKSTLARALHDLILEHGARSVTSLDGDVVRRNLSAGLTFSREDRETNIRRIGWVAAEIARHGGVALCSPIAPFDETRQQVRRMVEEAGGAFFLVHVATPLEECERRDRKGLYAKARRGEIPEFTGISSPYDEPLDVAVRVDTTGRTITDTLDDVLDALRDPGYLDLTQE